MLTDGGNANNVKVSTAAGICS